jgi:arginine/ornithine transport system substrate-binding protein
MPLKLRALIAVLLAIMTLPSLLQAAPPRVRIATSADSHPYNFGKAEGCQAPSGACGFEIDLYNAICQQMGLRCEWQVVNWDLIFKGLVTPDNSGNFPYDVAIASIEASPERRQTMLFSPTYYQAWHLFAGRADYPVKVDRRGFPIPTPGKPIRMGTWEGFLMQELRLAYKGAPATSVQLIPVKDPIDALKKGELDLIFIYTGIEMRLIQDPKYKVKSPLIPVLKEDPYGGVGAAMRVTLQGRAIEQAFANGLVKVRRNGTYLKLSMKWLGRDIWDCELGPQIKDPVCMNPKLRR